MTSTMPTTTSVLARRAEQRHSKPSTNMAVRLLQWNANGILKPDKDYCPTGYHSVRIDRPTAKGGLITFICNGLIYTEARRPADMECQAVNIRTSLVGKVTLINVYVPPTHHAVPGCSAGIDGRTEEVRRTSSVRPSIPAEQHHHSR